MSLTFNCPLKIYFSGDDSADVPAFEDTIKHTTDKAKATPEQYQTEDKKNIYPESKSNSIFNAYGKYQDEHAKENTEGIVDETEPRNPTYTNIFRQDIDHQNNSEQPKAQDYPDEVKTYNPKKTDTARRLRDQHETEKVEFGNVKPSSLPNVPSSKFFKTKRDEMEPNVSNKSNGRKSVKDRFVHQRKELKSSRKEKVDTKPTRPANNSAGGGFFSFWDLLRERS